MSHVILGSSSDVYVAPDPEPVDLVLIAHGKAAEVRTSQGALVLPIADEVAHPILDFLVRRIYRLVPSGPTPFNKTWSWFVRYQRDDQGLVDQVRIATVAVRLVEGSREPPHVWAVDVVVEGVVVGTPELKGFTTRPNTELLPPVSKEGRI